MVTLTMSANHGASCIRLMDALIFQYDLANYLSDTYLPRFLPCDVCTYDPFFPTLPVNIAPSKEDTSLDS